MILLIGWTVKYFVEQRRRGKAEEERKKEVDRLFKEESERISEILKKFPDRKT